jgi:hypothetical protein
MHAGKLGRDNAATRVYRVLQAVYPGRISNWDLQARARTVAVSTRVSEVNRQLPEGEHVETIKTPDGFFYGLVKESVQLRLAI